MYLQESGRAGRDGGPAQAILVRHTSLLQNKCWSTLKTHLNVGVSCCPEIFLAVLKFLEKAVCVVMYVPACVPVTSVSKSKLLYKLHKLTRIVKE